MTARTRGVCAAPGVLCALLAIGTGSARAAPVDRVVVYSDQARVFRRTIVVVDEHARRVRVGIATLPPRLAGDSLRVRCDTARVERVELRRRPPPLDKLAARLEPLVTRALALRRERRILAAELAFVSELEASARVAPKEAHMKSWQRILRWQEARTVAIQARLAALDASRRQLEALVRPLRAPGSTGATEVVVTLSGPPGTHQVELSYRVARASWVPRYDLRYDAAARRVTLAAYARVRQRSGEEWSDARLRFSTARPAAELALPRLAALTLGRRRDFDPLPTAVARPGPRPWQPAPPSTAVERRRLEELLRLLEGKAAAPARPARPPKPSELTRAHRHTARVTTILSRVRKLLQRARRDKDVIKVSCLGDKLIQLQSLGNLAQLALLRIQSGPSLYQLHKLKTARQKAYILGMEAEACVGGDIAYVGATRVEVEIDDPFRTRPPAPPPTERVPWTVQGGRRTPPLDRDAPAVAAGGRRYLLPAPGRHLVPADGAARRIPLFSTTFAVEPTVRIVPGRSLEAFLVATVTNTSGRPILRGHASLLPAGRTWLNTALPGRPLTIHLGQDPGIKVARRVRQHTATKGVFFKDDATDYHVELQLANAHPYPVRVELLDQVPLARGEGVEVRPLVLSGGGWRGPDRAGRVRWRGRLGASSVKRLGFGFRIVRPKDYNLERRGGGAP